MPFDIYCFISFVDTGAFIVDSSQCSLEPHPEVLGGVTSFFVSHHSGWRRKSFLQLSLEVTAFFILLNDI